MQSQKLTQKHSYFKTNMTFNDRIGMAFADYESVLTLLINVNSFCPLTNWYLTLDTWYLSNGYMMDAAIGSLVFAQKG